jgi:hypothetical protein
LGCACWPNLRSYNKHKLYFRSKKCVFLGYSPRHKGVKFLDPNTGRVYISRDVVFDENQFPFVSLNPNASHRLCEEILLLPLDDLSSPSHNRSVHTNDHYSQVVPHVQTMHVVALEPHTGPTSNSGQNSEENGENSTCNNSVEEDKEIDADDSDPEVNSLRRSASDQAPDAAATGSSHPHQRVASMSPSRTRSPLSRSRSPVIPTRLLTTPSSQGPTARSRRSPSPVLLHLVHATSSSPDAFSPRAPETTADSSPPTAASTDPGADSAAAPPMPGSSVMPSAAPPPATGVQTHRHKGIRHPK